MIKGLTLLGEMVAMQVIFGAPTERKLTDIAGKETGEIKLEYPVPTHARIVQCGTGVPVDSVDILLDKIAMMPSGNVVQLINPDVFNGTADENDNDVPKYIMTHYKNIAAIYS